MGSISDFSVTTPEPDKPSDFKEATPPVEEKPSTPLNTTGSPLATGESAPTSGIQLTGPATQTLNSGLGSSPAQSQEEILQGILGKIGDKIGDRSNLKMIIYGDPGSMKSSFLATAPNNLIADLDEGLIAAKFSPHGIADNVRPVPWEGFEEFAKLIGALIAAPPELDWVEVFSIDTFSEVHKRALAEITEREWRKRPSTNRYVPETEHHMENNERMIRMVRALKDMRRDIILLTHATTVEPKGKPAKTYPDFSEKLANKLEAMMDVVAYAEKKMIDGNMHMVLTVKAGENLHCKTRIPLPSEMIDPTFADIKKVWEESKSS